MTVPTPASPQDDASPTSGATTPASHAPASPTQVAPRPRAPAALLVLAVLAVAYTLWAAQEIILPVLLAMFFALVGNPIIRGLRRLRVPRFVAAVLVLAGGLAAFGALGTQLVRPAAEWIQEAPWQLRQVGRELRDLARPVLEANRAAENIARAAGSVTVGEVEVVRTQIDDPYGDLAKAPRLLATLLAVVLLTLFFMVFGEHLQRNALALLPTRQRQRFTADILASIEREISRYVFTITLINVLVGLLFAALLHWLLDVAAPDALLWGTVVALLNFAPYVGPLIGVGVMLLMGFVTWNGLGPSLLPAAIYLALHTIEGQIVTPIVLGRRMHLSPLVLVLALMVFGWLWGIVGLLLAVPLLVCVKLVLARIDGMEGWARLME